MSFLDKIAMRKNSIKFLLAGGLCGIASFQTLNGKNVHENKHPNVIFILTDDMGYGDLGVLFQNKTGQNNNSVPRQFTPHLDKLASNGVQLQQQYCAAPVCAPSRASFLLGQSQGHANVRDNQFDKALEDNYTLGTVMQKAGYSTAAFGKWGCTGKSR